MFLQSVSDAAMEKSLSALWQRAQLITHNIANEDTPGYKAKRLSFEQTLSAEIRAVRNARGTQGREQAIQRLNNVAPRVYEDTGTIGRADGNNVDVTAEQIEMARVQLQYQALSQKLSGRYSTLKYAISGGR